MVAAEADRPETAGIVVVAPALFLRGDEAVVAQHAAQRFERHVSVPYANDGKTALGQIGILRSVALLLGNLPIRKGSIPGVSVPPFPVGLDDESADPGIDDELVFDDSRWFVGDPKAVEALPHPHFETRRFVPLDALSPLGSRLGDFVEYFGVIFLPFAKARNGLRVPHRIPSPHPFANHSSVRFVGNAKTEVLSPRIDRVFRSMQCRGNGRRSLLRIMGAKVLIFLCGPPTGMVMPSTVDRTESTGFPARSVERDIAVAMVALSCSFLALIHHQDILPYLAHGGKK